MKKNIRQVLLTILIIVCVIFLAFKLSPYPSVWLIRYGFNKEAIRVNKALEQHVSVDIVAKLNIQYDPTNEKALMDVYYHRDSVNLKQKLPVIVWTHGGGLISGDKSQVGNYCKILAANGYLVVSIDYTIAPEAKYPTPIQQLNTSLAYLTKNSTTFYADTNNFILAGDSGGSMITATAANVITNPSYAELTKVKPGLQPNQLKGLLLYCGIYEIDNLNEEGAFASFLQTVMWAYFDKKDISNDPYAQTASVSKYLTTAFPPTFISAGNRDPLLPQSIHLAESLKKIKVPIETLFFPNDYQPALEHEYQFKLDESGKEALNRSLIFIKQTIK